MNDGYIKIHRKIRDWEWSSSPNVFTLFVHLLLLANHKDNKWKGMLIKRGQLVTGRKQLAKLCGMSEQSVRTSLEKLKKTQELTIKPTNKFSVITIVNYSKYQELAKAPTSKSTNNQPTTNQQLTTNKNDKNEKNIINKENFKFLENEQFCEFWDQYLKMRKSIKKPATLYAQELALKKLHKYHIQVAIKMLENSIMNSWQGLFELKGEQARVFTPQAKPNDDYHDIKLSPEQVKSNKATLDKMRTQLANKFGLKK